MIVYLPNVCDMIELNVSICYFYVVDLVLSLGYVGPHDAFGG